MLSPARLWLASIEEYRRGHRRRATVLKSMNFWLFRAVLPVQCDVATDVVLMHHALNVVIHPNTTIGRGVLIGHGVTIAATSSSRVYVGDHVFLGSGCTVAAGWDVNLRVGSESSIGVGSVVTSDIPSGSKVRAPQPTVRPLSERAVHRIARQHAADGQ